jgi:3-hydroxybutyryl-CoA dehydrogenase
MPTSGADPHAQESHATRWSPRVGVVGCGLMGSGIAEVCARSGLDVDVFELTVDAADAGRRRIERSLMRARSSGKIDDTEAQATLTRISVHAEFERLAECELLVEAVAEDTELKLDLFRRLDRLVRADDAILVSNTSSIPIMKIAMATNRPERVIGVHFFNPVPVLELVEIVPSMLTSEETELRATSLVAGVLGKRTIRSQDRAGFVVNSLLVPYILAAIRMYDSGFATAEDIDTGMVLGCAHPMGPLRLADLIGLDTLKAIAEAMYEEFKEPLYSPAPFLLRMVEAGLLGKKSGRGFFSYPQT